MILTLEMQAQEQGSITIRKCDCHPNGGYASQGLATLQRNGDAEVQCDCGRRYEASWSATFDPKTNRATPNIISTSEDFPDITFDNYILQREKGDVRRVLSGDEHADVSFNKGSREKN